jgi:hypothetical protein
VTKRCVVTDGSNLLTIPVQSAAQPDSTASNLTALVSDFNALLAKLRAANIIMP